MAAGVSNPGDVRTESQNRAARRELKQLDYKCRPVLDEIHRALKGAEAAGWNRQSGQTLLTLLAVQVGNLMADVEDLRGTVLELTTGEDQEKTRSTFRALLSSSDTTPR